MKRRFAVRTSISGKNSASSGAPGKSKRKKGKDDESSSAEPVITPKKNGSACIAVDEEDGTVLAGSSKTSGQACSTLASLYKCVICERYYERNRVFKSGGERWGFWVCKACNNSQQAVERAVGSHGPDAKTRMSELKKFKRPAWVKLILRFRVNYPEEEPLACQQQDPMQNADDRRKRQLNSSPPGRPML